MRTVDIRKYRKRIGKFRPIRLYGRVAQLTGLMVQVDGLIVPVGEICLVHSVSDSEPVLAEVIGFNKNSQTLLMVLGDMEGIAPGCTVEALGQFPSVKVGDSLVGRVIDGMGEPIDGKDALNCIDEYPIYESPPHPLNRDRISEVVPTGVRALDALFTLGEGQRIGVFGGSGVGKTIMLSMIARNTEADLNVLALIGERGREVRHFVKEDLGEEGLKRSVVVAATSDQPALTRIRGAFTAITIAEYFRNQGKNVMFMMDSITRFAMAQREVGMTLGEPPTTRGYTPSVFALLPKLLERASTAEDGGSITGIYAVLVEGDDMNEPISDAVRSILDGHIVLSRELASQGHYPAIDILSSISRLMVDIVPEKHLQLANKMRQMVSTYRENQTLIDIGLYQKGTDPEIDRAIKYRDEINQFLRQGIYEKADYEETISTLKKMFEKEEKQDGKGVSEQQRATNKMQGGTAFL